MRLPLVYCSQAALRDAARLLGPRVILEREAERAIIDGRVVANRHAGRIVGEGWVAHFRREPGRLRRSPRAWRITHLERSVGQGSSQGRSAVPRRGNPFRTVIDREAERVASSNP